MRNGRLHSPLIKALAAQHGVSERSARNWRNANDPRWVEFLAARAIETAPTGPDAEEPPGATGLQSEIARCRVECVALARRVRGAEAAGQIDLEVVLSKQLNESRRTLRELERDTPEVSARAGTMIPFTSLVEYATAIKSQLECLPSRVATLLPEDVAAAIREQVTAEVERIMVACSEVEPPE